MANFGVPWNKGITRPDLAPLRHPSMKNIYWAAGIYEGEGSCQSFLAHRSTKRNAVVTVAQKDGWLCQELRELFGGKVRVYRIKGDSQPDRHYHRWDLYGSRAVGFLETIYAMMSPRRQHQIRVVIDAVRS